MHNIIIGIYRTIFSRKCFEKFNKLIFFCGLSGLGILNYENDLVSGERNFLEKFLKNKINPTILDVGANQGNYAKTIFTINSGSRVIAFEPHPATYKILQANLSDYQTDSLELVNAAVGHENGHIELFDYADRDGSTHASIFRNVIEVIHQKASTVHRVPMINLDHFCGVKDISRIDLLKIDTEGNELMVLRGFENYLREGLIEVIHFEFNEMNLASRVFFRDFWDKLDGYSLFRLLPNGMLPIRKYSPITCEIFAYQNIVAMRNSEKS